jgi:hypothetical protein
MPNWRPFSSGVIGSWRFDPSGHVLSVNIVDRGWKLGELGGNELELIPFSDLDLGSFVSNCGALL